MSRPAVHRTILVVDVEGSLLGHRSLLMREALAAAGISWSDCDVEDRGDGMLVLISPLVPKSVFVERLPRVLASMLHTQNEGEQRMRLRMALHAGEVRHGDYGFTGESITLALRLLESAALKTALAESASALAIITSQWFFEEVVLYIPGLRYADSYRQVRVAIKETDTVGWICLPDQPGPLSGVRSDFFISYVGADRHWAEWIAAQLRGAGYTVVFDRHDFVAGENFAQQIRSAMARADRVIAVWSEQYLRSVRTMSEGTSALDQVIPIQMEPTEDATGQVVIDLVGLDEQTARERLLAGVAGSSGLQVIGRVARPTLELGDVFKPAGVPTLTFVEPDDFIEFKMALRQPGLGVVIEGPSGIGKTTVLRHAVKQDADRLGVVPVLSARKPSDVQKISQLPEGHTGIVAVDDFHRLPAALQDRLVDYLKLLADDDDAPGKLVLVGIPGTAQSLVALAPDVATRIRVFRLGRVAESLVSQMVAKGEDALNISFDNREGIAGASTGSLLTAQMLCWHLAMMAGIERTTDRRVAVPADIRRARAKVADSLRLKYQPVVDEFTVLDAPSEPLCIELLLALADTPDGVLRLDSFAEQHPDLVHAIKRVFGEGLSNGFSGSFALHLYYDPRGHRLIADDPQFLFYLRQLSRYALLEAAGKRLPVPREQIFVCYSHRDASWLDRIQVHLRPLERHGPVDLWSDRRIEVGDVWRTEIAAALARARIAVLLVSADFLASDFIHSNELPPLLAAADEGGCRVVPILVRPSMFAQTPSLERFQCTPSGSTLSELPQERAERVLTDLARALAKLIK